MNSYEKTRIESTNTKLTRRFESQSSEGAKETTTESAKRVTGSREKKLLAEQFIVMPRRDLRESFLNDYLQNVKSEKGEQINSRLIATHKHNRKRTTKPTNKAGQHDRRRVRETRERLRERLEEKYQFEQNKVRQEHTGNKQTNQMNTND